MKAMPENLGEILGGEAIENSGYMLYFLKNEYCKFLNRTVYQKEHIKQFKQAIAEDYRVNMIADNLPSAAVVNDYDLQSQQIFYDVGFPLGHEKVISETNKIYHLHNHAKMTIHYHNSHKGMGLSEGMVGGSGNGKHDVNNGRIVGFVVEPLTVLHKYQGTWQESQGSEQLTTCFDGPMPSLDSRRASLVLENDELEVIWTYDVVWRFSKIEWASRWDVYLSMAGRFDDEVHWFSITSSSTLVLLLGGLVAMIMVRTLRKDIAHYNRIPTEEERQELREESGWKLVNADVFRAPAYMEVFCVLNGTGVQLLVSSVCLILFAAAGYLSPARRGAMVLWLIILIVSLASVAGYTATYMYKMFKGTSWRSVLLWTALFFPCFVFGGFFSLNLLLWADGSTKAIPFLSLVAVSCIWFMVSVPLAYVGGFMGYRRTPPSPPVAVSKNPRAIPEPQPWFLSLPVVLVSAGLLPFAAVSVEISFIYSALWLNSYYYLFGFLLLTWFILIFTVAEVSIVFCYLQLCSENYHWWWRSFFVGGSIGLYVFGYSVMFFYVQMDTVYMTASVLYFSYTFLISMTLSLIGGALGFQSCLYFVRSIYGSIKVD
jgi:transmembrane 9 superfamily protein 2/4